MPPELQYYKRKLTMSDDEQQHQTKHQNCISAKFSVLPMVHKNRTKLHLRPRKKHKTLCYYIDSFAPCAKEVFTTLVYKNPTTTSFIILQKSISFCLILLKITFAWLLMVFMKLCLAMVNASLNVIIRVSVSSRTNIVWKILCA